MSAVSEIIAQSEPPAGYDIGESHDETKVYSCPHHGCDGMVFYTIDECHRHEEDWHDGPYICTCKEEFAARPALKRHIRATWHQELEPGTFSCAEECWEKYDEALNSLYNLTSHKRSAVHQVAEERGAYFERIKEVVGQAVHERMSAFRKMVCDVPNCPDYQKQWATASSFVKHTNSQAHQKYDEEFERAWTSGAERLAFSALLSPAEKSPSTTSDDSKTRWQQLVSSSPLSSPAKATPSTPCHRLEVRKHYKKSLTPWREQMSSLSPVPSPLKTAPLIPTADAELANKVAVERALGESIQQRQLSAVCESSTLFDERTFEPEDDSPIWYVPQQTADAGRIPRFTSLEQVKNREGKRTGIGAPESSQDGIFRCYRKRCEGYRQQFQMQVAYREHCASASHVAATKQPMPRPETPNFAGGLLPKRTEGRIGDDLLQETIEEDAPMIGLLSPPGTEPSGTPRRPGKIVIDLTLSPSR